MADKPKGKWAESASAYRPGSATARGGAKATRPWHVDAAATASDEDAAGQAPLAWARTLPLDALEPDPDQPRRTFDDEALAELATSIREHGVLQPLIVRRKGEGAGYIVVAGERRFRAARLAGISEVPCSVLVGDSLREARLAQLAENLQREDLAPMEEALAVVRLAEIEELNQDDLGKRLGKSAAYISRIFAVSRIPSDEYDGFATSKPTMSVLYEYAQLRGDPDARRVAHELIRGGGTVRELETLRGRGAKRGSTARNAGGAKRGRPMAATAPLESLRRAARALGRLDAAAIRRLGVHDRTAILAAQAEIARWCVAAFGQDEQLGAAVRALEAALTRASGAPPSTPEDTAGRAGRKARSSRPR